jgi:hypothetical protein
MIPCISYRDIYWWVVNAICSFIILTLSFIAHLRLSALNINDRAALLRHLMTGRTVMIRKGKGSPAMSYVTGPLHSTVRNWAFQQVNTCGLCFCHQRSWWSTETFIRIFLLVNLEYGGGCLFPRWMQVI